MDLFYHTIVTLGRFPFWVSSRPTLLHQDRVPRTGPFILASNHLAPYDVAVLMRHTGRVLDFVSTTEVMSVPLVGSLYHRMGAYPLDRGRVDVRATRWVLDRLRRGRVVAMFPEGRIRPEPESVVHTGDFRPSLVRLARTANVPILPAAVRGTQAFAHARAWLPTRSVAYGLAFGSPIHVTDDESQAHHQLTTTWRDLYAELARTMTSPP
jgi:1-acyl-sn-glycerol-3-phosphate acyltransferase